jgi:chaperone protein EcpD
MYCLIELLLPLTVLAGIQLNGTRVIYPAGKREVTLGLTNRDIAPRLIQAWVDKGDNEVNPQQGMSAFIVIPLFFAWMAKKSKHCVLCILVNHFLKIGSQFSGSMCWKCHLSLSKAT